MAPVELDLQLTPSPSDCLAWSEDGLLAIAALENVHVMIPRRSRSSHDPDSQAWLRIMFRANSFTVEEWPLLEPRSSKYMSIGEEQSDSIVTAIAWSPLGLARNRRPVLAVLTANHRLSCWASTSNIKEPRSWEKVLVIDNSDLAPPLAHLPTIQRIRSMAWAPSFRPPKCNPECRRWKWGMHILAIGLDDGGLHIVQVLSPFNTESECWQWTTLCRTVSSTKQSLESYSASTEKDREGLSPRHRSRPSLFRNAMETSRFIDGIAFSPWTYREDQGSETVVSFRTAGITRHLTLSCDDVNFDQVKFDLSDSNARTIEWDGLPTASRKDRRGAQDSRVVGRAAYGPIIATCITQSPRHEISYRGPAEDICTILFEWLEGPPVFPWRKPIHFQPAPLKTILHALTEPTFYDSLAADSTGLKILYAMFMAFALISDMTQAACYSRAQSLLLVIERFNGNLKEEREFLAHLAKNTPSNRESRAEKMKRAMEINLIRGENFHQQGLRVKGFEPLLDNCPACSATAPLAYNGVGTAICRAGHVFDRCKLTLLPLTDPHWQKTCLDCELEFISEHKYPEMNTRLTSDREKLINRDIVNDDKVGVRSSTGNVQWLLLANAVFDKFDKCPYCGGYYTG